MTTNRRDFLQQLGGAGAVAMALSSVHSAAAEAATPAATGGVLKGPYLDLTTGKGTKIASARMVGDIDPTKKRHGWYKGIVMAVRPGSTTEDLFGFQGFGTNRMVRRDDGAYLKMHRELGLYTDLKTGEVLESWHNPYLNEDVKVVPVANDPFSFIITDRGQFWPGGETLGLEASTETHANVLPWQQYGDMLVLQSANHHSYPNHLKPEKWVRESSGPMVHASEMSTTFLSATDMQNPELTAVPTHGVWGRRTPWLPWMLMGTAPGHCLYSCVTGTGNDLEQTFSRHLLDYVEKHHAKYFDAPAEWTDEPNRTSLENYALEQQPEPFKDE